MQDNQNSNPGQDQSIRGLSRGLAVLQAINRGHSVTVTQVAADVQLPYPTTLRIIRALVQMGMIEQEPSRKYYRPTALVLSLAHGYQDHTWLTAISRPYLVEFTTQTNWPALIATPVGPNMIIRDGTHTLTSMTLSYYYPGFMFPVLNSAAGQVCLAFFDDDQRQLCLNSIEALGASEDIFTLNRFRSGELAADIRLRGYAGYARNRFAFPAGKNSSVAAPIFSNGRLVAAVAAVFFASAMRMEEAEKLFGPLLVSIGKAISEKLSIPTTEKKT